MLGLYFCNLEIHVLFNCSLLFSLMSFFEGVVYFESPSTAGVQVICMKGKAKYKSSENAILWK